MRAEPSGTKAKGAKQSRAEPNRTARLRTPPSPTALCRCCAGPARSRPAPLRTCGRARPAPPGGAPAPPAPPVAPAPPAAPAPGCAAGLDPPRGPPPDHSLSHPSSVLYWRLAGFGLVLPLRAAAARAAVVNRGDRRAR
ncbi:translation initiation factor IF-2-like [Pyrgilauda ruficollis]|uniref:translation initiation factor IF-2-like n=1 Tax=Pyrgilauda ruficollis TaxID=221976 RepID=UPI001B862E9B|nr:translation initiation factor IF-2-like [Pyrgilauda ruficollis]